MTKVIRNDISNGVDMDSVMSQLYGASATQLLGGRRSTPKKQVKGGKSSDDVEKIEMLAYAKYEPFIKFKNAFYIDFRISNPKPSSVFIVPPEKTLNSMIKEFEDKLEKEGIPKGSSEAVKYALLEKNDYKKYVFVVYPPNITGIYKLDNSNISSLVVGRISDRGNLNGDRFWFKVIDETTVEIHNTEACVKDEFTVVKLKVACGKGVFVFEGLLPEAKESINKSKTVKVSKKCNLDALMDTIEETGDVQEGSLRFISGLAHTRPELKKKCVSVIGGNLLNSALNLIYELAEKQTSQLGGAIAGAVDFDEEVSNDDVDVVPEEDLQDTTYEIIKASQISNKKFDKNHFSTMFKQLYKNIAAKNLSPSESTRQYKKALREKYSKLGMSVLCSDVCTALIQQGYTLQDANDLASALIDDNSYGMEELADVSKLEYIGKHVCFTSKYNSVINSALLACPLPTYHSRTVMPPLNVCGKKKCPKKKRTTKKAIEEIEIEKPKEEVKTKEDKEIDTEVDFKEIIESFV